MPQPMDVRSLAETLLSRLLGTIDGAVDTGTSICIGPSSDVARAFTSDRAEVIESLVVVIRDVLGVAEFRIHTAAIMPEISGACRDLASAIRDLPDFRVITENGLRGSTTALEEAYQRIRASVRALCEATRL